MDANGTVLHGTHCRAAKLQEAYWKYAGKRQDPTGEIRCRRSSTCRLAWSVCVHMPVYLRTCEFAHAARDCGEMGVRVCQMSGTMTASYSVCLWPWCFFHIRVACTVAGLHENAHAFYMFEVQEDTCICLHFKYGGCILL